MRTSIHTRLSSGFNPDPTRGLTQVALPLMSPEDAMGRAHVEVTFGASHSSSARVTRDLHDLRCALVVLTIRPGARQLTMLVTMFGACLHVRNLHRVAFGRGSRSVDRISHVSAGGNQGSGFVESSTCYNRAASVSATSRVATVETVATTSPS